MIYAMYNFMPQAQQRPNANSVNLKQCFCRKSTSLNNEDKESKQKLPTWGKLLITWCIGDMITDLIIDRGSKDKDGFNLLRPFSWIFKKIKK